MARKPIQLPKTKWANLPKSETESKAEAKKTIKFAPVQWNDVSEEEIKDDGMPSRKIEVTPSQWDNIEGLSSPSMIRQFDGVNTLDPFSIKDSYATRILNFTSRAYPALQVRNGTMNLGLDPVFTSSNLISSAVYSELGWVVTAGTNWYEGAGLASVTNKSSTLSNNKPWEFIRFQGGFANSNILATNGVDKPKAYDEVTKGFVDLPNAPDKGQYITLYNNRIFMAKAQTLYYSALRKGDDWTTVNDAGQIVVETQNGANISGIAESFGHLMIFKLNSIHELFGSGPDNFQLKLLTENVGCAASRSIQYIDGELYFLYRDGIYRYSGGSLPENDFSLAVREYTKYQNTYEHSFSWVNGRKYYLCLTDTLEPSGLYSGKTILEYDTQLNSWHVWEFPKPLVNVVPRQGFSNNTDAATLYLITNDSRMMQWNDEAWDFDKDFTQSENPTDIVQIPYEWVSKPFTFQSMSSKSRWYRLWITASIPVGANMNIHVSPKENGENWTLIKTVTPGENTQSMKIPIPVDVANFENWIRLRIEGKGKVTIHEIAYQDRSFPMV